MTAEKAKKVFQVAKELNVATPAIIDFLEDRGFDVGKKHMSSVTEDMYVEVVKKFDPARWNRQLEDETRAVEGARRVEADRARTEQSLKLLDELAHQATEAAEALIQQVQDQKDERVRKAQQVVEQAEQQRLAEEKRVADEAEKKRKEAEELARKEAEAKELEKRKEEQAQQKAAAPPAPRPRTPEQRPQDRGPRPDGRPDRRPQDSRPPQPGGDRRPYGPRPDAAGQQGRPQKSEGDAQSRQPRTGDTQGRPPRTGSGPYAGPQGGAPRPAGQQRYPDRAPRTGPPAPPPPAGAIKPKDPLRKRPTKEDIEALEKQKRLLAQQKAEKYRKVAIEAERDAAARRKQRRKRVDSAEVSATIKQTLASMDAGKKKHRRRERTGEAQVEDTGLLKLTEFVTNQELANLMDIEVNELIAKFLSMGKLVSINQRLDKDLIELVADEFGYRVEFVSDTEDEVVEEEEAELEENLQPRPPVVTVMGHVDHGKTSLLDFLRKTSVVAGEHGGITQHVGAYKVQYKDRAVTFLDTPGHEAFTAMRARGAQVTDIVILVVAADDQVRPQTIEAINHAQSAGVPIVVAINKVDKPNADPERIRQQLAEQNILVEQWGGKYQSAEISAKFGQGIEQLLDDVLLAADLMELKANFTRRARGTVIETRLDKGRGMVATLIVTGGTLKVGDNFVAGQQYGKVRSLLNEIGGSLDQATPGEPVQVVGFSGAPTAGDNFVVFESEREVKEIAMRRQLLQREQTFRQIHMLSLDQISQRIKEGGVRELQLIVKGDADGSVEAICDTLQRISTSEVAVNIVHRGVGAISESDVLLASATGAIILGFHVHPNLKARELAQREQVDIRVYRVIYEMEDDIRLALEGLLAPDTREDVVGLVEIRQTFEVPKVGVIAGSYIVSGKIVRSSQVRLIRDGREIWRGKLASLRRFKDDVKEVRAGQECGIGLETNIEVKVGDSLEVFEIVEVKRKLEHTSA